MSTLTIVDNPDFADLTPEELLTAYDNRGEQIDTLKAMWDRLNREQIEIMTQFYKITEEDAQS